MDQGIRNKLRNVVTQCRKLLEESVAQTLQGQFGIYGGKNDDVHIDDDSRMTHLSDEDRAHRKDIIDHLEHIKARSFKPKDALDQLIREIAFTHLNRLCAYKMMEVRDVYIGGQKFRETVSRGTNSNGFKFYLADHAEDERLFQTGKQDIAYRHFLDWLGGTLSEEIGILFNPNDSANRLYPPQRVLDEILNLLNTGGIKPEETDLKEQWPNIWAEDETIGWVYQYFTPKELRDKVRKESGAPRNSYELAFRNQFYTPRYVVKFLTDNTLGRIWYEMRRGDTKLKDQCRYLVRRPKEIFLDKGKEATKEVPENCTELSQEELSKQPDYIIHRPKKDPRELKIFDPACGSGHFLLYSFDLLQTIYEEAYDDPDIGAELKRDFQTLEALRREMPAVILRCNLHGIDIDLRSTQIAALALWLRCQRAYQEKGLKNDRPSITRSNIVCAEPMPGEREMLKEFIGDLRPKFLGQLVEVVFNKMTLAAEAGSLLKIDEELRNVISEAKRQWLKGPKPEQLLLFEKVHRKPEQQLLFDLSGITDEEFWTEAEGKVLSSLLEYSMKVSNGTGLQRRLFAEDTERGFAFVDLCRQRFDVILMNPPFGEPTASIKRLCETAFADQPKDLYCWFVSKGCMFLKNSGLIGTITSSSFKTYVDYEKYRTTRIATPKLKCFADLGWEVLDEAYVEAAAYCIKPSQSTPGVVPFFDVRSESDKGDALLSSVSGIRSQGIYWRVPTDFTVLDSMPIIYEWPVKVLRSLSQLPTVGSMCDEIGKGAGPHAIFYRLRWEIPPKYVGLSKKWAPFANGGSFSPFRRDDWLVLEWDDNGRQVKNYILQKYPYLKGNTGWNIQLETYYGKRGITYGKKTTNFSAQTLPNGFIFSFEGIGVFPSRQSDTNWLLAYLNSSFCSWFLNVTCGLHKNPPYLRRLPIPNFSSQHRKELEEISLNGWKTHFVETSESEMSSSFLCPSAALQDFGHNASSRYCAPPGRSVRDRLERVDSIVWQYLDIEPVPRNTLANQNEEDADGENDQKATQEKRGCANSLLSYAVGCAFGRWDVRFVTGEQQPPGFPDPFAELPVCSPGMLRGRDGLPAAEAPRGYPLQIKWDGILLDDSNHPEDIVRRVREVLEVIWKHRAEAVEKKACEILGTEGLRDYFSTPGKGRFWEDHVVRYSKSHRKAPIYWLLQSAKRNYAVWVYYHRLYKDTLFGIQHHYVEPKIQLEQHRLAELRAQRRKGEATARDAKQLDKKIEQQEDFLSELDDFREKLERAANLAFGKNVKSNIVYDPDLNDGVLLNIAPLHELVPWKEAKKCWDELLKGEYEWSSMSKLLKKKGLLK